MRLDRDPALPLQVHRVEHLILLFPFLDRPGKLLEFDIVRDDIEKLHAFFQPELDLSKGIWGQLGQTGKGRPEIMKTS